jgi:hypothetical protein
MVQIRPYIVFGVVSLLLTAGSPTGAVPPEEPAAALASTVTGPYTEVECKGEPSAYPLIPASQGFCYLAGVQGYLNDDNDQAGVYISQGQYGLFGSYGVEGRVPEACG